MSQLWSMKSTASQSSSSGCVGYCALRAEVGGGGDDAGAEEDLPESVHFDAGGERVAAHGDPFGEAEAVGGGAGRQRRQDGGRAGGDFFRRLRIVATAEDVGLRGCSAISITMVGNFWVRTARRSSRLASAMRSRSVASAWAAK